MPQSTPPPKLPILDLKQPDFNDTVENTITIKLIHLQE